jgi:hypothetical protein
MEKIYLQQVLGEMPRLLGLLDRNLLSNTYGCFDRQYWQYNTIDTPSARSQEAVLTLALLYEIKGTPYYKNKLILEWINSGIEFWMKIQRKNGSFNEWYPNENSFVATAFSGYAISETILLLKGKISKKNEILKCMEKAGEWLMKKKEKRVQNQEAGALIFIYNLYILTKKEKYNRYCRIKSKDIAGSQTKEGWFYEYGGADIGYLSLMIDYLVKYYKKSGDSSILKTINKSIDFISYFIHPNLTAGGEYGSRNTEYLIPSGFEIMSKENDIAPKISEGIRKGIKNKEIISPSSLDDRYLTYITYNWLHAYKSSNNLKINKKDDYKLFSKEFKLAKIYIISEKDFHMVINYGKGGVFKLVSKKSGNVIYDGGVLVHSKKSLTTGNLNNKNKTVIKDNKMIIEGNMSNIKKSEVTPIITILIRLFQLTIGKNYFISKLLKEKLRDMLVTGRKTSNIKFTRIFDLKTLELTDTVKGENMKNIFFGEKSSYTYTPSSRYFQISELKSQNRYSKKDKNKKVIFKRNLKRELFETSALQ